VIAEQDDLAFHDEVDALARIGTVADDVAKTVNLGHILCGNVRQDCRERLEIAVDVADDGFHNPHSPTH